MSQKLKVHQCKECDRNSLLAPVYCPNCRKKNSFAQNEVEGIGEIVTYTVVHVSEHRFNSETPYPLAIIELKGNLRVLGRIVPEDVSILQIGKKVTFMGYKECALFFKVLV